MRSLHLTILIFCQVLLASFIFYSTVVSALPINERKSPITSQPQENAIVPHQAAEPMVAAVKAEPKNGPLMMEARSAIVPAPAPVVSVPVVAAPVEPKVVLSHPSPVAVEPKEVSVQKPSVVAVPVVAVAAPAAPVVEHVVPKQAVVVEKKVVDPVVPVVAQQAPVSVAVHQAPVVVSKETSMVQKSVPAVVEQAASSAPVSQPLLASPSMMPMKEVKVEKVNPVVPVPEAPIVERVNPMPPVATVIYPPVVGELSARKMPVVVESAPVQPLSVVVAEKLVAPAVVAPAVERRESMPSVPVVAQPASSVVVAKEAGVVPKPAVAPVVPAVQVMPAVPVVPSSPVVPVAPVVVSTPAKSALVKGGLGPLHLLAATLCSYQPERPVADETLNLLYNQRAALRKSLFDFMSLKFTNLEKLSSRLNPGFSSLEVVPQKTTSETPNNNGASVAPSHGWPVVGKCTAHDLKLMAEAAWCETNNSSLPVPPAVQAATSVVGASSTPQAPSSGSQQLNQLISNQVDALDKQEPKIVSNQHMRARSLDPAVVANEQASSVISKLLHVNDAKDAPVIESSLVNSLNATQRQQLASAFQQVAPRSTRECRRSALRLTKSLFNHLAEDQKDASESWPLLYSQMAEDECARKRMIDIVTALSNFRGDATGSIRRDNVEYAFAMDDLRAKVLENEVNVPLTFDKQFIEVEQFLQQSVKLMLANIDPERARLTSMRYRSLMPGPFAADDQCIELHQRLLAKNYPTDCNPAQFGQLPDVLRMAANSLALWSVETELSKHSAKIQDYPLVSASSSVLSTPTVKQDINECIAHLVAS